MFKITTHHQFDDSLHISASQIFTYLNCSLRYFYQKIECRPAERISIALPFGSAIHAGNEHYCCNLKNHGAPPPEKAVIERFEDCFNLDMDNTKIPVIYKRDLPDRSGAVEMGKALLKVFCENNDLRDMEVIGVEVPLEARLYTENKEPSDYILAGVLDLIVCTDNGQPIIVDFKTASKAMVQSAADDDNQMTAYSYLLAAEGYVESKAEVQCRFDVLRKLKTPKYERVETVRTAFHRRRFAKLANAVLTAIDHQIFLPKPSWMCSDCPYADVCKSW